MRIAVLDDWQRVALSIAPWERLGDEVEVTVFANSLTSEAELVSALGAYDVIVAMRERTPFPAELLESLPSLKLLITTGMHNAAIDVAAATRNGITVCGTRSTQASVTELTWALMLSAARNLAAEIQGVRCGGWQHTIGVELEGSTLGLLGLGRTGKRMLPIARAFGMRVIAWSKNLEPRVALEHGAEPVTKDELFRESDYLSIHLVLSDRTRGLVGDAELGMMKKSAYLINTSRGPIVSEDALLSAVTGGRIRGAALDVFDIEPLPKDHPLRTTEAVTVTPHIGYVTEEQYRLFYSDAIDDILGFASGRPERVLN